jgi:hypothetical protein
MSEVVCNGCRSEITGGEWITLYPPIRKAEENYHYACWQTGWYTGIEPKGEWPTPEGTPPADLPTRTLPDLLSAAEGGDIDFDPVNSPSHYTWLNGIEVIEITEHFGFLLGNVLKYVMRADRKGKPIEDLEKAAWYLAREIANRKNSGVV